MDATGIHKGLTSYGDPEFSLYLRRAFLQSAGYDNDDLNRPIVGIANTSSDFTTCHRDMPQLVDAVKRGVLQAGGLPLVFPTASLGEILLAPTSMLYRNLLAMETEEMMRAHPMDACVLLGGCDKTVPAQLMAAASAGLPALLLVVGPMLTGRWEGERIGACTDCRRLWSLHRAEKLTATQIADVESSLCFTGGTCMVMGTASTMACVTEALGMMLPGTAAAPAPTGDRLRAGVATGRRAVGMAREGFGPSLVLTPPAFHNALVVLSAIGGSTNAIIHLLAVARRAGVPLTLDDFDRIARVVPLLVDCKPTGSGYLEDFHHAGGVPALMKSLEPLLELSALRADDLTLGEYLTNVTPPQAWQRTIRRLDDPFGPPGSLAVLHGSLAPDGAVIKVAAASPHLLRHRGPAMVLESPEDAEIRLGDPNLDIPDDTVLILRNAGPMAAAMPEAGSLPIPRRLLARGITDMVRISDARMSGTAYGTVVLHCSPEAARGGPLALVRDGDLVDLNVPERRVDLLVDEIELGRRQAEFRPPVPPARGWRRLYFDHVLSADRGADLDFLLP